MANNQDIDFSRFSPDLLKAIEKSARFASNFNGNVVTPCLLIGGLASEKGREICSLLKEMGYDPDASMHHIAQGMAQAPRNPGARGISFDSEVALAFANACRRPGTVDASRLVKELICNPRGSIASCLVEDPAAHRRAANFEPERPNAGDWVPPQSSSGAPQAAPPPDIQLGSEQPSARSPRQEAQPRQRPASGNIGNTIKKHCIDMLEMAERGRYRHAIGRDEELKRVILILTRSTKNNPVLVGEPGTGKTAIAEELALRLHEGNVPPALQSLRLFSLDYTAVKSLPDAKGVLKAIFEEATANPDIALFIDEIHMIISNSSSADNDIANLLKPAMARGEIKVFGATTIDEYKRIEKDPAFERRFQKVIVDEPDVESAIKIVTGAKGKFEQYHHVQIPDDVCKSAVNLSVRYITNRRLPDKAFDLIDEAAANLRVNELSRTTLQVNDLKRVVTVWTGIPVDDIGEDEATRLQNIEKELHESVVGQDKAIKAVADAIRRSRMGLTDANKPIGSFLFLGTTGTGKTELCKAIAKFLFRDPSMMVRIDMSEYQQEHSSSRLFGAPPGYVGYDQGGQLTEAVRRKPFSVVLFDEIEKAHPKIFQTLLQTLDDGRMTDGQGRTVDFKNTIIVMTSNMGHKQILQALCGREATDADIERCKQQVSLQLQSLLAPEFLNRIDTVVMFLPLSMGDVSKIADINLKKETKKFQEKNIEIVIDPSAKDFVVRNGYDPEYGGRPVKRAITDHIVNPLTSAIINGAVDRSRPIHVYEHNNKIEFSNVAPDRI